MNGVVVTKKNNCHPCMAVIPLIVAVVVYNFMIVPLYQMQSWVPADNCTVVDAYVDMHEDSDNEKTYAVIVELDYEFEGYEYWGETCYPDNPLCYYVSGSQSEYDQKATEALEMEDVECFVDPESPETGVILSIEIDASNEYMIFYGCVIATFLVLGCGIMNILNKKKNSHNINVTPAFNVHNPNVTGQMMPPGAMPGFQPGMMQPMQPMQMMQ